MASCGQLDGPVRDRGQLVGHIAQFDESDSLNDCSLLLTRTHHEAGLGTAQLAQ